MTFRHSWSLFATGQHCCPYSSLRGVVGDTPERTAKEARTQAGLRRAGEWHSTPVQVTAQRTAQHTEYRETCQDVVRLQRPAQGLASLIADSVPCTPDRQHTGNAQPDAFVWPGRMKLKDQNGTSPDPLNSVPRTSRYFPESALVFLPTTSRSFPSADVSSVPTEKRGRRGADQTAQHHTDASNVLRLAKTGMSCDPMRTVKSE